MKFTIRNFTWLFFTIFANLPPPSKCRLVRPAPPLLSLPYLVAIISMIFLSINLPQTPLLYKPAWGTLLFHRCPDIIWGNGLPPQNIWGDAVPRVPPRLHHWCRISKRADFSGPRIGSSETLIAKDGDTKGGKVRGSTKCWTTRSELRVSPGTCERKSGSITIWWRTEPTPTFAFSHFSVTTTIALSG